MSAPPRYFANDQPLSRRSPDKQLVASLERIVKYFPPKSVRPGGGLYYGPMSIALLFFVLSKQLKGLEVENEPLTAWCHAYLGPSPDIKKEFARLTPDHCGIANDLMTYLALSAASSKNPAAARKLCDCVTVAARPDASNEWLYGRAGYLYLLRLAKNSFPNDDDVREAIDSAADKTIEAILGSPQPWTWHGKEYVGAAHGIIGIITQVVLSNPSYASQLEERLASLLQSQYESGNWPSSLPPGSDRLVQFCHGAPGVVSSLLSVRQYFPTLRERIDDAVVAGQAAIKRKGLLTKEPCLCHGISGNALALEHEDLEHFLSYTTREQIKALEKDGLMQPSDHPESLWCGEAGRAWAWAVAGGVSPRRFLGYNDL